MNQHNEISALQYIVIFPAAYEKRPYCRLAHCLKMGLAVANQ